MSHQLSSIPAVKHQKTIETAVQALKPERRPGLMHIEHDFSVGTMEKWFEDKAFGFSMSEGRQVFIHKTAVRGGNLRIGNPVVLRVIEDPFLGEGKFRVAEAWSEETHVADRAQQRAREAAEAATVAARPVQERIHEAEAASTRAAILQPPGLGNASSVGSCPAHADLQPQRVQVAQPAVHTAQAPAQYHQPAPSSV